MLITPRIGVDRARLLRELVQVETDLKDVRGHGHSPVDLFQAYLNWANNAVRTLRHSLRQEDLGRLVLTRRYWTIQAMAIGPVGMASNLVEVELNDRTTMFKLALQTTRSEFKRWDERGRLVVADTSFFHQHPDKLDEADLSKVIGSREAPISLVVPMVIIDELEKQKTASQRELRWRSSVTLAVIERVPATADLGDSARLTSPASSEVRSLAGNTASTSCSTCLDTCGSRSTTTRSWIGRWRCSCCRGSR